MVFIALLLVLRHFSLQLAVFHCQLLQFLHALFLSLFDPVLELLLSHGQLLLELQLYFLPHVGQVVVLLF